MQRQHTETPADKLVKEIFNIISTDRRNAVVRLQALFTSENIILFRNQGLLRRIIKFVTPDVFNYLLLECQPSLAAVNNQSLFHIVIVNPDVLKIVTDRKRKLYLQFNDNTTDLDAAALSGAWKYIRSIFNQRRVNTPEEQTITCQDIQSILYWACVGGHYRLCKNLLAHKFYTSILINDTNNSKYLCLYSAAAGAITRAKVCTFYKFIDPARKAYKIAVRYFELIEQEIISEEIKLNPTEQATFNERKKSQWYSALQYLFDYYLKNDLEEARSVITKMFTLFSATPDDTTWREEIQNQEASLNSKLYKLPDDIYIPLSDTITGDTLIETEWEAFANEQLVKMKAAVTHLGLDCINTPDDGNCFFTAVAHQLVINGYVQNITLELLDKFSPPSAEWQEFTNMLRIASVSHIENFYDDYSGFFYEKRYGNKEACIEDLKKPNTWADNTLMTAFANVNRAAVIIFFSDPLLAPKVIAYGGKINSILAVGFATNHYVSLPCLNTAATERLKKLVADVQEFVAYPDNADREKHDATPITYEMNPGRKRKKHVDSDNNDVHAERTQRITGYMTKFFSTSTSVLSPIPEEKRTHTKDITTEENETITLTP